MAERKSMIHVRGGFSEAHGMGSCNTQMQINELDDRTRIILCNRISENLDNQYSGKDAGSSRTFVYDAAKNLYRELSNACGMLYDVSESYFASDLIKISKNIILKAKYSEVFDFLELICKKCLYPKDLIEKVNQVFEQEYVGYRIVDGWITPITDENEIDSIEKACNNEFDGTRAHIKKAVGFVADRERKDYKNCIKESISAVESVCSIIVGNEKATLGQAIKRLEDNGLVIHSALKNAFSSLYGYTSDEGGIRHSEGMFESDVTFEEAKFMLVSCSAFVNYLTANYGKVGGKHA